MLLFFTLRMALRALRHHILRSLLTLLGIVIGIMGIITISAVGKGAQQRAREQWLAYGTKSVTISRGNWMNQNKKPAKHLLISDLVMLKAQCPMIEYITPEFNAYNRTVAHEDQETKAHIDGINEQGLLIEERTLSLGNNFTSDHILRKENVVIIPIELAERFFKNKNPLGHFIRLNKVPFEIIGVLAPKKYKGKWDGLRPPGIYIPHTTHKKYFQEKLQAIKMSVYRQDLVAELTRQLEKIMRSAHALSPEENNDFMIFDTQTFAAAAEKASQSVGIFAFIAALIALFVGGIGVMNILLVSVHERTKEIGIKGALGASPWIIRVQFLSEAIIICFAGGLLGVVAGVTLCWVLTAYFAILALLESLYICLALMSTLVLGLLCGIYPAERAARLNPVNALIEY